MHVKRLGDRSPNEAEDLVDEDEEKRHLQDQFQ